MTSFTERTVSQSTADTGGEGGQMAEAFLVDGVRTPIGRYGGALATVRPDDLAALVLAELVKRTGVDPDAIDQVLFGAANQAGEDNRNVARMATLLAGLPDHIAGVTVNQLCASGLQSVTMAAQAIKAGEADLVLAGGVESMTRAPWVQAKPEKAFAKPGEQFRSEEHTSELQSRPHLVCRLLLEKKKKNKKKNNK